MFIVMYLLTYPGVKFAQRLTSCTMGLKQKKKQSQQTNKQTEITLWGSFTVTGIIFTGPFDLLTYYPTDKHCRKHSQSPTTEN